MDTVAKTILEEDEEESNRGLKIFGRDVSKIPCFRDSLVTGILSGVGIGMAAFIKTSKPLTAQHVGVAGFVITTLSYWSYCRLCWSQQKFDAQLMQEALKHKMVLEGTKIAEEIERSATTV